MSNPLCVCKDDLASLGEVIRACTNDLAGLVEVICACAYDLASLVEVILHLSNPPRSDRRQQRLTSVQAVHGMMSTVSHRDSVPGVRATRSSNSQGLRCFDSSYRWSSC